MNHYYLAAALPELTMGSEPPLTMEELLFSWRGVLSEREWADLERLREKRPQGAHEPFVSRWLAAEAELGLGTARIRAERACAADGECDQDLAAMSSSRQAQARYAFEGAHPLEVERRLDRARWEMIEDLTRHAPFSFAALLGFTLKLEIAWRWALMDEDAGRKKLDSLVEAAMKRAGEQAEVRL